MKRPIDSTTIKSVSGLTKFKAIPSKGGNVSDAKKVAFVTTCKGRLQHLQETLPVNMGNNHNAKFVVLDYNSRDGLLEYLVQNHSSQINQGRLAVYSFPTAERFQMAHAKNMAHRC